MIRTRKGRITFWSPEMERRYGFPGEAALDRTSQELLRPRHWQSFSEIEGILDDRSEWNGGLIVHRMDGQPMMVANYWHLHSDAQGMEALVTEVHMDIVQPGSPASTELADVVMTIAHELSQPLAALGGFIAGTRQSMRNASPDREVLDRRTTDAAAQLARASELVDRMRGLGTTLRDPKLRELHRKARTSMAKSARIARYAQKMFAACGTLMERAEIIQHIGVFRRRLAAIGVDRPDDQSEQVLRRLLAEEEAKLAVLDH